ncbi:MAG: DUF4339 domain-containing protein [Gemmataceae bacterium]
MPAPQKIYALFGDERRGPFAPEDLAREGVGPRTLVWYAGCADWLPAGEASDLDGWVGPPEPPVRGRYGRGNSRWADRFEANQPPPEMHLHQPCRVGNIAFLIGQISLISCGLLSLFAFWLDFLVARDRTFTGLQVMFVVFSILLGFAAAISLTIGSIFYLVFLYRCWEIVQEERTETTPGMAIGLLFVPLFNIFWSFIAIRGLAVKANEYAMRHRLRAPRAPQTLGLAVGMNYAWYPLVFIVGIGFIGLVMNIFVFPAFAKALYRTFRCFTLEHRTEETDEHLLDRPMSPTGSLAWGLPAQILAWFAAPAFVIGMIATAGIHGDSLRRNFGRRAQEDLVIAIIITFFGVVGIGVSLIFARLAALASRANNEGSDPDRPRFDDRDQLPQRTSPSADSVNPPNA